MKIGISACLCGEKVRYDGTDRKNETLLKALEGHELIPICPELTAGFSIPHEPLEIRDGRVCTQSGEDVTDQLNYGCKECLDQIIDCDMVILKEKSPSCGIRQIYDGSFSGTLIKGSGLFARLCMDNAIPVLTEDDIGMLKED